MNGRQVPALYRERLENHLLTFAVVVFGKTLAYILRQDNASIHTSTCLTQCLREHHARTLPWTLRSPDFNIFDHIWGVLPIKVVQGVCSLRTPMISWTPSRTHWRILAQISFWNCTELSRIGYWILWTRSVAQPNIRSNLTVLVPNMFQIWTSYSVRFLKFVVTMVEFWGQNVLFIFHLFTIASRHRSSAISCTAINIVGGVLNYFCSVYIQNLMSSTSQNITGVTMNDWRIEE